MTYTQAKLRIEMPEIYPLEEVIEAAILMLSKLDLNQEDFDRASFIVASQKQTK